MHSVPDVCRISWLVPLVGFALVLVCQQNNLNQVFMVVLQQVSMITAVKLSDQQRATKEISTLSVKHDVTAISDLQASTFMYLLLGCGAKMWQIT